MLAPRVIPDEYRKWNSSFGAPSGFTRLRGPILRHRRLRQAFPQIEGPFAIQANNTIHAYEYPWAWNAARVASGITAVDLGGSLAGFQFALSRSGVRVINVDPGDRPTGHGWNVDHQSIARLNRAFRTRVELANTTLNEAALPDCSIDTVYSISTIEHIPMRELPSLIREIERILKPGGSCVLTIDLFLNLQPFSDRESNEYGINVPPRFLVDASSLELAAGKPSELLGYAEFDPRAILATLENYLIGTYPALAQCLVLRKPH